MSAFPRTIFYVLLLDTLKNIFYSIKGGIVYENPIIPEEDNVKECQNKQTNQCSQVQKENHYKNIYNQQTQKNTKHQTKNSNHQIKILKKSKHQKNHFTSEN